MIDLQLWGGIECSHCRVGNSWSDQLTRNGHRDRLSDLDAIAELGIRRLRLLTSYHCAALAPERSDLSEVQ